MAMSEWLHLKPDVSSTAPSHPSTSLYGSAGTTHMAANAQDKDVIAVALLHNCRDENAKMPFKTNRLSNHTLYHKLIHT
jgi:hypothetical protein